MSGPRGVSGPGGVPGLRGVSGPRGVPVPRGVPGPGGPGPRGGGAWSWDGRIFSRPKTKGEVEGIWSRHTLKGEVEGNWPGPPRRLLLRVVRILLECILVNQIFILIGGKHKTRLSWSNVDNFTHWNFKFLPYNFKFALPNSK